MSFMSIKLCEKTAQKDPNPNPNPNPNPSFAVTENE
jgi:hypothetical protein